MCPLGVFKRLSAGSCVLGGWWSQSEDPCLGLKATETGPSVVQGYRSEMASELGMKMQGLSLACVHQSVLQAPCLAGATWLGPIYLNHAPDGSEERYLLELAT